jgi:hypothetical protein
LCDEVSILGLDDGDSYDTLFACCIDLWCATATAAIDNGLYAKGWVGCGDGTGIWGGTGSDEVDDCCKGEKGEKECVNKGAGIPFALIS